MYRQPSKRKQLIQRIVVYTAMSAAVVGLVAVLIFIIQGYQFNRADGHIEQGGLMQFNSVPGGADVTIDGMQLGTRTAAKTTATAGQHFVTMKRSGYRQWQKSVNLMPGAVLWLNYARLIPNDIQTENVADFSSVAGSLASPNGKWMAVKEDPASPAVHLVNISGDTVKPSLLTLPATSFTAPVGDKPSLFSLETWDPSSRFLLMKHTYGDSAVEWLVVDTQDATQTKNITTLLNVPISKILFSDTSSNILYVQTDHDVRKVDIGAGTLSRPLVSNVAEFSLADNSSTIVYTTVLNDETKQRSAGYYPDGADKPYVLRTYTDDGTAPLHVALGTYFSEPYVALSYGNTVEVLRGRLPTGGTHDQPLTHEATLAVPGGAQFVAIRTNGRFVVAQQGDMYYVYDNELKQSTKTTLKGTTPVTKELGWLDGYMPWSDRDGMVRLYEFDGANQNDIMPVVSGQSVALSPNGTYLYGISKTADGTYHLTRARLILQ